MANQAETIARLILLVQTRRRVSMRRVIQELSLSRSTAYRMLGSIAVVLPIELVDGVVLYGRPSRHEHSPAPGSVPSGGTLPGTTP